MIPAPLPANEEERLKKLYELDIMDTLEEQAYDDITYLVAQICDTPIALVSLIDRERQFLKSHHGLDVNEVSRELGFCPHAILDNNLMVVEDATKDERFHDNPLVTSGPQVKFYAGAPLIMPGDLRIGTLCVVAHEARTLSDDQARALEALARQVVSQLQLHQTVRDLQGANNNGQQVLVELAHSEQRERSRSAVLEKLAKGRPLNEVLETLALGIESDLKEGACSILLVGAEHKHLQCAAAPSLPEFYKGLVEGLELDSSIECLRDPTHTGKRMIVTNIKDHPFGEPFRTLAAEAGLAACWSEPIVDGSDNVVGFFAIYFHTLKSLNKSDVVVIEHAANLAGIAVQRKKEESALLDAKQEAETANTAKSEFLSSMSHELRTPLNAILGFGQLLGFNPKEPLSDSQQKCVDQIMSGGQHLLHLINDILDLSKIEAGQVGLSIEDISPLQVLDECLPLITSMAMVHGIDVSVPDTARDTIQVRADHTRFKQVLLNLLSNAIKYNRENGSVIVATEATPEGMLRISVTDTGDGIPKQKLSELFKPFNRLGAEGSGIEGNGIGLVISKKLVELMGGAIGVQTEVGKGTTFWIELPLVESGHHETVETFKAKAAQADRPLPAISGTLLYVEDNPDNLKLMEVIVSYIEGLSMISAHTGELGIELARAKQPDMIVLDINLPGMNGFEVLNKLQSDEDTKHIPTIALTALATKKDIEKGLEAGFLHYLTKPIQIPTLMEAIKSILAHEAIAVRTP